MRTLRNVFRRRLRAFLTIFGITIGVFALVVMGSMAEKITLLVNGGTRYYQDKVTVTQGSLMSGSVNPSSVTKAAELERMDGVEVASATVTVALNKDSTSAFSMGPPDYLAGSDLRGQELEGFPITYSEGRALNNDDTGKAVLGSDMVRKLNARVGDTFTARGRQFEVIGVMDKTFTAPDNGVIITMQDAQDIYYDDIPDILRGSVDPRQLVNGFTVYPKPGADANVLAQKINDTMPGYNALGPAGFEEQITSTTRIFTTIVFGVALISLIVGGLSVINTMTMSVFERTREVGIRKALGASDGRIIRQFLGESALIGGLGGLSGLLLGWLFVMAANAAGESSGTVVFLLTGRLAVGAVAFAVGLGVLSGLYPSWHAARMNPVRALRYE